MELLPCHAGFVFPASLYTDTSGTAEYPAIMKKNNERAYHMDYNDNNFYDKSFITTVNRFENDYVPISTFFPDDFSVTQAFLQGMKIVDASYCNTSIDGSNEKYAEEFELILLSQTGRLFSLSIFPNLENNKQMCVAIGEVFLE